jgi:hypothetical protein
MPVRYILALSQVVKRKPMTRQTIDRLNSQYATVLGTPNGILDIITIGEKNGMILLHLARELVGSLMELIMMIIAITMGMVIGNVRLCASWASSFTALPTAANKAA